MVRSSSTGRQRKIVSFSFSIISIMTRARAWRSGVRIPAEINIKLFFKTFRPAVWPNQRPRESGDKATGGVSWTTYLYIMPWLRVNGAMPPFLYALMTRVQTALPIQTF
jgi:hypothetical protein